MHRFGTPFNPPALVVLMYFSECVILNKVKFKLLGEWGEGEWEVGIEFEKLCALLEKSLLHPCRESIACTQTMFYFSFRSFRKHRRARERSERTRTSAEREKEIYFLLTPLLPPCAGGQ